MQLLAPFVGSFICCLIDNYPHFLNHKHSECPFCHHRLSIIDLLPIFSYLKLKGKCRYCGKDINPESFVLEICYLTMSIILSIYAFDSIRILILYSCLLVIVLIDFKQQLIPDTALFIMLIMFGIKKPITMIIIFVIGIIVSYKKLLGFGDVKLLMVLVNTITMLDIFKLLFISSLICLIVMLVKRYKQIAYGPFIILGWLIVLSVS